MPYDVVRDSLEYSDKRPGRVLFSFFLTSYHLVVAIAVTVIVASTAGPHAPLWTALFVGGYWLYFALRQWVLKGHRSASAVISNVAGRFGIIVPRLRLEFVRSIILIAGVFAFLWLLYHDSNYLRDHGGTDTLWLLFILATFIMSQRGSTQLMLVASVLAAAAVMLLDVSVSPEINLTLALAILSKVSWLGLLAFIHHMLLRSLGSWSASLRVIHAGEAYLSSLRSIPDDRDLLEKAVLWIADEFGYEHVLVFGEETGGLLLCQAGSSPQGELLARKGFRVGARIGIVGHVYDTGQTYVTGNSARDPHYDAHPIFPATKSELAVPVIADGQTLAVLDVQSSQRRAFSRQDIEVVEIIAGHLGRALDNRRLAGSHQRISLIVQAIADRLLSSYELDSILDEIVQAAHDTLRADVVILYGRNPASGELLRPRHAGELKYPELFNTSPVEADSLVFRLLDQGHELFHSDAGDYGSDPLFAPGPYHKRSNIPPFAMREGIRSRAIIPLSTDTHNVGLMFLNFRSLHSFDSGERSVIAIFAHLAALAMQKAMLHQAKSQADRDIIARELHERVAATADSAWKLIKLAARGGNWPAKQAGFLEAAQDTVEEMVKDVRFLLETARDNSIGSLPEEVQKLVARTKLAYGVDVETEWTGNGNAVPASVTGQLKLVLMEAILNGIRHGEASAIWIALAIGGGRLELTIQNDGQPFNPEKVAHRGIANIKTRVRELGGECRVESEPGKRVSVLVWVPIGRPEEV